MAAALESSIAALLRPLDQVKVILETQVAVPSQNSNSPGTPNTVPSPDSRSNGQTVDDARMKRVLAVVSHSDGPNSNTQEEGSVFILKFKPTGGGGSGAAGRVYDQSDILRVFPVFGDFSISMAQVQGRRAALDLKLRPTSQASGSISLTIKQGDIQGLEPLTLVTQDVQTLRDVLAECKRLKDLADAPPTAPTSSPLTTFSWLAPYTARRTPLPALFSLPQDLRVARKPLHTRLSAAFAGEAGDDFSDIVRIRDEWIRAKVRDGGRRGRRELRIRIGSFNVNGNLPSQDLSSWIRGNSTSTSASTTKTAEDKYLPPLKEVSPFSVAEPKNPFDDPSAESASAPASAPTPASSQDPAHTLGPIPAAANSNAEPADADSTDPTVDAADSSPDLLVLGFQEMDLSTEALLYATSTVKEEAWCTAAFAALGELAEGYEKLASKQLVGMLIVVIVKKVLRPCFDEVKTCAAGTGMMGLMGNKGGTAIRMKFIPPADGGVQNPGPTVLTFVNAHLAAFDEMYEKRNADFHDLAKRLQFDLGVSSAQVEGVAPVPVTCNIFQSDVLFWMVNLNYRIDVPDADVRAILGSGEWEKRFDVLMQYDQLKTAVRANKAFEMFSEGAIMHLPTYRFNTGLLKDDLGYDLKRRPAWTDRVLYTSNAFAPITQLSYDGHPQITQSDHRPVSAEFHCVETPCSQRV